MFNFLYCVHVYCVAWIFLQHLMCHSFTLFKPDKQNIQILSNVFCYRWKLKIFFFSQHAMSVVSAPNRHLSDVQSCRRPTTKQQLSCWNLRSWISMYRTRKTMDREWSQPLWIDVWRWLLPGTVVYKHLPASCYQCLYIVTEAQQLKPH